MVPHLPYPIDLVPYNLFMFLRLNLPSKVNNSKTLKIGTNHNVIKSKNL